MSTTLAAIAKLNMLLAEMEEELQIDELSYGEKQVLLAIVDCVSETEIASLADIQNHPLTASISRPTLFRALKQLEENGQIRKLSGTRGRYALG